MICDQLKTCIEQKSAEEISQLCRNNNRDGCHVCHA